MEVLTAIYYSQKCKSGNACIICLRVRLEFTRLNFKSVKKNKKSARSCPHIKLPYSIPYYHNLLFMMSH